jgi:biopolymer transport protein ExbB/TolQ
MNFINVLQSALYLVMNALLYPVVAALIVLIIAALLMIGGFISEALLHRRQSSATNQCGHDPETLARAVAQDLGTGCGEKAAAYIKAHIAERPGSGQRLRPFLKALALQVEKGADNFDTRCENLLQTWEHHLSKTLDNTRIMVRIGPMLGLMGTLIPMGPALLSLSQGDLAQMANCLMLAFGTTVSGLAVGIAAYVMAVFRERWHSQDMGQMEYLVDLILGHLHGQSREAKESGPARFDVLSAHKVPS